MTWLFLSIVLDFGFVQLFKLGERRGYSGPVVVTANYLTVATTIAVYLLVTDQWEFPIAAIYTGLVTGVLFITALLLMNFALRVAPVGPVMSVFRMAIVVPVFFGVYLWGETMTTTQVVGLTLALVALFLMTPRSNSQSGITGLKAFGLLAIVCLWQGISHTSLRSVHYNGLDDAFLHVLVITGTTAGVVGSGYIFLKGRRPTRPAVKLGIFIGAYNAVALCVILIALSKLPGTLFFPALGCSVVLLDNLFAQFFWREPLTRLGTAGVAIAILALFLVI